MSQWDCQGWELRVMLHRYRNGGRTCPRIFSEGSKSTKRWCSEYLRAAPERKQSFWKPQMWVQLWFPLTACLATVHTPLWGKGPIELPRPAGEGTWALRVGNQVITSKTRLLLFLSSPDPWLSSSRLEAN